MWLTLYRNPVVVISLDSTPMTINFSRESPGNCLSRSSLFRHQRTLNTQLHMFLLALSPSDPFASGSTPPTHFSSFQEYFHPFLHLYSAPIIHAQSSPSTVNISPSLCVCPFIFSLFLFLILPTLVLFHSLCFCVCLSLPVFSVSLSLWLSVSADVRFSCSWAFINGSKRA